ncbi:hypothetical protein FKM82_027902 [Ascaphus truei]
MASRLPILPRTKRVRCDENQESTEKKRFRASSPDKDPPVVRVAASIATSRLRAPPVAAMPRAQVIGRQSLAPIRPKNRMPAVVSAGVAQSAPAGDKRKRAAWDLKGQVTDMRDKVNNFKDKVQGLSGENQRLQLSAGQMRRNLEALTCENTKLSQANCALELELQAAQQKLTVSEAEMGRLSGLCVRQEAELRSLNHTVEELQEANGGLAQLLQVKEVKLACSESEVTKLRGIVREQSEDLTSCRRTVAARDAQVHALETERRRLHNLVQELKGNIRVFCRVRPALHTEETLPASHISFPKGDEQCIVLSKTEESHVGRERKDAVKYDFSFDCVFPPSCGQPAVFEEIELLVQSALDGYPVCIFAYGQTGSGKTYTMEGPRHGSPETMGMIPRAIHQIFRHAEVLSTNGWEYTFTASFLEIYNESLRDLLVTRPDKKLEYEIRKVSSTNSQVYVTNLRYVDVASEEEVHELLRTANANRSVAKTALNDRSSRSHSVFQLKIEGENLTRDVRTSSLLSLIDLAGSERLDRSLSIGDRLRETQCINTSLSNLGLVITSLCNKEAHVPYRNSKLTYLLQNSLGGNAKMLMFVNISPLDENFAETLNSLRFASKVNECVIGTARANRK